MLTLEYDEDIAREVERQEILEEGLKQGLEQGKEQRNIEIVKNSLKAGLTVDQIALITGLDKNIILSLKDK